MNNLTCSFGEFDWVKPNLLRFTVIKTEPNVEDIKEYRQTFNAIVDAVEEPFIFIFDATRGKWMEAKARIEYGKSAKESEARYKGKLLVTHIVIPNKVLNAMLKGIHLISKPTIPQKVHKNLDYALKAAEEDLAILTHQK